MNNIEKLRKLIREQIEEELNSQNDVKEIITYLQKAIDIIDRNIGASNVDLDDMSSMLEDYIDQLNDIEEFITYDDESLNEGDYEISSKLPPSEIEKKKKEIKTKDPKATIAVKDPMLREEEEEDLDDDAVDKQAQKGAKTINRKASKLDRVTRDLVQLQGIMKEMAKKYQTAEGEEKEKIVADLKQKTKAKKELEALKAQLEAGVVGKGGEVGLETDEA